MPETPPLRRLRNQIVIFMAGATLGAAGVSRFVTSAESAAAMIALGLGLLSVAVADHWTASGRVMLSVFVVVAGVTWGAARYLTADIVPQIRVSLVELDANDAAPHLAQHAERCRSGDCAIYRLMIQNTSERDVTDLHVVVHLPSFLMDEPSVIHQVMTDDLGTKAGFLTETYVTANQGPITAKSFANIAVVEARRMQPRGLIDVAISAEPPDRDYVFSGKRPGWFGDVVIDRRHTHFGNQVQDHEAFAIAREQPGTALLDQSHTISGRDFMIMIPPPKRRDLLPDRTLTRELYAE